MSEWEGQIRARIHYGPLGTIAREYSWEGGPRVAISRVFLQHDCGFRDARVGSVVTIGPYQLRLIDEDLCRDCYYAMRDGWRARGWMAWYSLLHPLTRLYRRLIMTAAVWGLARWDHSVIPTWRDIHAVRWLAERRSTRTTDERK